MEYQGVAVRQPLFFRGLDMYGEDSDRCSSSSIIDVGHEKVGWEQGASVERRRVRVDERGGYNGQQLTAHSDC